MHVVNEPDASGRDARRARGRDLVADARGASRSRYRGRSGIVGKVIRGLGDFLGEMLGEAVFAFIALALFAAAVTGTVYGWQQSPTATIGVYAIVVLFLAYGVLEIRRVGREGETGARRSRLAGAAAVSVVVTAVWLTYVAVYR